MTEIKGSVKKTVITSGDGNIQNIIHLHLELIELKMILIFLCLAAIAVVAKVYFGNKSDKLLVTHEEIRYSLTINPNPSDAGVQIVNPRIDYQPGMRLRPGSYQIQVSREGFGTKEDRIEIKDQDVLYSVTLKEIKYALTVNPDPSDAAVSIMNIFEPYKPGMLLKPGAYDIRVSKAGYKPFKETKEIKDSVLILSISLEKIPESPPKQQVAKLPHYQRRKEPITTDEPKKSFDLKRDKDDRLRSFKNANDFKDNKDGTITDRTTGLMWQKSGSSNTMRLTETPRYIEYLNHKKFAGYNDWRLPTVDELNSLLTSEKQATDMYISPIFDQEQWWCWTSGKDEAWSVNFRDGKVEKCVGHYYVRAVRSRQ